MLTSTAPARRATPPGSPSRLAVQSLSAQLANVLASALLVLLPSCSCSDEERRPGGSAPDAGSVEQVGLVVGSPEARACDILLEEQGAARARGADFGNLVRGRFHARSPLVALSFFNRADQGFSAASVVLDIDAAGEDAPIVVRQATCFDRRGQPLDDAAVELRLPEE